VSKTTTDSSAAGPAAGAAAAVASHKDDDESAEQDDEVPDENATVIEKMQARERFLVRKTSLAPHADVNMVAELASLRQLLQEHEATIRAHEVERERLRAEAEEIARMKEEVLAREKEDAAK